MQSVFQFWGRDLFDYSLRDVGLHFAAFALLSAVGQAGLVGPILFSVLVVMAVVTTLMAGPLFEWTYGRRARKAGGMGKL